MSDTDEFSADELAVLKPDAPQPQPPAKVEAVPETPASPEPPAAETPKLAETVPEPAKAETTEAPKGAPNAAIAAMRREIAELRRQLGGQPPAPKPEKPALPALDQDPVTNLDTRIGSTEQSVQEMVRERQMEKVQGQVLGAYRADVAAFSKQNPDFGDAYNHWHSMTSAYMAAGMPGATPQQVEQAVQSHEFQMVYGALQQGVSPAETILNASRALRWAPAPKEAPKPAAPAETLVQEVARGQQMAANPMAGAGATPTPELTAATLAAMSDDDFAQVSDAKWRRAMGG